MIDESYLKKAVPTWKAIKEDILKLQRTFIFKDFQEALAFVINVGKLAEREQHHPDIIIHYNKVTLSLYTHSARGLTERDIHLAQVIDRLHIKAE